MSSPRRLPDAGAPDGEGPGGRRFQYPAGSRLVKRALNPLERAGDRFADLVKPDVGYESWVLLGALRRRAAARSTGARPYRRRGATAQSRRRSRR